MHSYSVYEDPSEKVVAYTSVNWKYIKILQTLLQAKLIQNVVNI